MGMGYAFALFLTVLVLAPVLWLLGWALDFLTGRARRPQRNLSQPRPAPPAKPYFNAPRQIDIRLPARTGEVGIYRMSDLAAVDRCTGPDAAGRCPRALDDGTVPCGGHVLALPVAIRGGREWHVPARYEGCPLASYQAVRPAAVAAPAGS